MPKSERFESSQRTLEECGFPIIKYANSLPGEKAQSISTDRARLAGGAQGRRITPRRLPVPEDRWRKSNVPADEKITKTQVYSYYRLKADDFRDLVPEPYETDAGWDCWLYPEVDIERLAWKKHGDPDLWNEYLEKLKKRASKGGFTFRDPRTRDRWSNIPPPPTQNNRIPPRLLRVRDSFVEQDQLWLWESCIQTLDQLKRQYMRYRAQEACLDAAREQLDCPKRPRECTRLPSSPKVDHLRSILAEAPIIQENPGTETREQTKEWDFAYLSKVNDALLAVVNDCRLPGGSGDEAKIAAACWEVYDKYVECISGPTLSVQVNGSTADNIAWEDKAMDMFLTPFTALQPGQPSTSS